MRPLAIYIHIPFCARKCAYCDFASYAGCEQHWGAYLSALKNEIADWSPKLQDYEVQSVFIGGGTPSLVPAEGIAELMAALYHGLKVSSAAEISIEANPETIDLLKLLTYRSAGINRISLGVQSFDDALLKLLGRIHTAKEAQEAVELARDAGFQNINIDLMYALPTQSMADWARTLERATQLPVTHISAYSLIVEEGTPMYEWVRMGKYRQAEDDEVNEMQRMAVHRLSMAGFARYEISNFAKDGYECKHNLSYWQCREYLGFGSAAHSLFDGARFHNPDAIKSYLSGERMQDYAPLTDADKRMEMLMLNSRTTKGLELRAWQETFGEDFVQTHEASLDKLARNGFVELTEGYLRLSPIGLELQDAIVLELMDG